MRTACKALPPCLSHRQPAVDCSQQHCRALKNFYAFRRSRVHARSNPGTGDRGGRCAAYIFFPGKACTYLTRRQLIYQVPKNRELNCRPTLERQSLKPQARWSCGGLIVVLYRHLHSSLPYRCFIAIAFMAKAASLS